jgi:cubilin
VRQLSGKFPQKNLSQSFLTLKNPLQGSYRCSSCPFGYDGDGRTCFPSTTRPNQQCSDSSICSENAQCFQYPNGLPVCVCKAGFVGNGFGPDGCTASSIDACAQLNCRNGGVCMKNSTGAFCNCPIGTSPPLCDRTLDPCLSNPCLNGGTCSSRRMGRFFTCNCLPGFLGRTCQDQVRKCGGLRSSSNGTISYPDSTDLNYAHNSRCAWLIKTNNTKVLNITFTKFDIEVSNDCKYDWLQVINVKIKKVK